MTGELHRLVATRRPWPIGGNRNQPMEMSSMAQRVSAHECVQIEEMRVGGVGVGEIARRLGLAEVLVGRQGH